MTLAITESESDEVVLGILSNLGYSTLARSGHHLDCQLMYRATIEHPITASSALLPLPRFL